MKSSIFVLVLVLLGIGTFQATAINVDGSCEAELFEFQENIKDIDVKELVETIISIVKEINDKGFELFDKELEFLKGNYATNVNGALAKIKSFLNYYKVGSANFFKYFNDVENLYNALIKKISDFQDQNVLTCLHSFMFVKGCKAELNALRCGLLDLCTSITIESNKAIRYTKAMKRALAILDKLAKLLADIYDKYSKGNGSEKTFCQLQININQLFVDFNREHWKGHADFVIVQLATYGINRMTSSLDVRTNCS